MSQPWCHCFSRFICVTSAVRWLYLIPLSRPYRLAVRTPPFHGGCAGSIPARVATPYPPPQTPLHPIESSLSPLWRKAHSTPTPPYSHPTKTRRLPRLVPRSSVAGFADGLWISAGAAHCRFFRRRLCRRLCRHVSTTRNRNPAKPRTSRKMVPGLLSQTCWKLL